MESKKPGRPKLQRPTRDKTINIRLTDSEFNELKTLCYDNRISYIDVLLKGVEFWSKQ